MSFLSDRNGAARFALAVLLWSLAATSSLSAIEERAVRADYAPYYAASLLVLEGRPARIYALHENRTQLPDDVQAEMEARGYPGASIPIFYSHPAIALALSPLALLDYPASQSIYTALLLAGQFLLGFLLWRRGWLGVVEAGGLVLFMILGYAGRRAIDFGQFQVAILILVGIAMLVPGRWGYALLLPPVVLAKPFFAPLVLFRPRDLRAGVLAFVPWLAAPLILGWETYAAYVGSLTARAGSFPIYAAQQGLLAQVMRAVQRIPLSDERWVHLHTPSAASVALYFVVAIPLFGLGVWQLRRHREAPMRAAAMIATSIAVSPFIWPHYAILFILPLVVLVNFRPRPLPVTLALAGVLVANLPYRYDDPLWLSALRFNVYLGNLLQLAAVALAEPSSATGAGASGSDV